MGRFTSNFRLWWHRVKGVVPSVILCIRFPFLYPRNRWTGMHYNCWKLIDYHRDNWRKAYDYEEKTFKRICINRWWAFKIGIVDFLNDYVLQIFHCVPTYTELDAMDTGWRKAFGIQICKEIKAALLRAGGRKLLHKYRITQIKEKYGGLRWYDNGAPEEVNDIIHKFEYISERTCICCGRPAKYITNGYILPYCEKCIPEKLKESAEVYYEDMDFYGVKKLLFGKNAENEDTKESNTTNSDLNNSNKN